MPTAACPTCETQYDTSLHLKCPSCGSVSLKLRPGEKAAQDATVARLQAPVHIHIESGTVMAGFMFGLGLFLASLVCTAVVWLVMWGWQFWAQM